MLEIADLMQVREGKGVVNVLAADKLMNSPKLYSTFLLWMLAELFEQLPEVGDLEKPKLVFFFDEAHLLFDEAPKALVEKVEQVVRLIRSKGVGVYFVTQNPLDVPESVLGQLGNRVQHALRAFTPRDQKAVKTAAETLRPNPEAQGREGDHRARRRRGAGQPARREGPPDASSSAPSSCRRRARSGRLRDAERQQAIQILGALLAKYEKTVDRESAYEKLKQHVQQKQAPAAPASRPTSASNPVSDILFGKTGPRGGRQSQGVLEAATKSAARAIGSELGRQIMRGVLGSILGGGRRR